MNINKHTDVVISSQLSHGLATSIPRPCRGCVKASAQLWQGRITIMIRPRHYCDEVAMKVYFRADALLNLLKINDGLI